MESEVTGMDSVFTEAYNAYAFVKQSIVYDGLIGLVGGIIIATLAFKIMNIVKDSVSEGKGISIKHIFEMGKEYMFCALIIVLLPYITTLIENLLSNTATEIMGRLAPQGAYEVDDHIATLAKQMYNDWLEKSLADKIMSTVDDGMEMFLSVAIGSFFAQGYKYIMYIFVAGRYMSLLMLELMGPVALACLLNNDTRNSFYTWLKAMLGNYMLYPGFIMASVFADQYTANLVSNTHYSAGLLVIYSFLIKLGLLAAVKAAINKWL